MATPKVLDFSFQDKPVRAWGTDRDTWFVAKDVCESLGIVWKGNETLADIPAEWRGVRKLRTPHINQYGQQGFTETEMIVIAEPAVYQFASRSKKPIAREFQKWLFAEVIPAIRKSGSYTLKRVAKYEQLGMSPEWIDRRLKGIETRKGFTTVLDEHGVENAGYGICTNSVYKPILGSGAGHLKIIRGLKPKENLRDNLSSAELLRVEFAEMLAAEKIEAEELEGNQKCAAACEFAAKTVASAIKHVKDGEI